MAQKRTLGPDEELLLRESLQTATIAALVDSRRWEPGELAFQGGTCLSLVHGSVRFSEDLDFMVRGGLTLATLSKEVHKRIRLPATVKPDLSLSVTAAKDDRNPHAFVVTLGGPNVIGSAKVKVELWQTDAAALSRLSLKVSQIQTSAGLTSYVPALTLDEILADKVYALGARDRIKARDIYDLWWILEEKPGIEIDEEKLLTRLDIYPAKTDDRTETSCRWMESAKRNNSHLSSPALAKLVSMDLKRWLPPSAPMNEEIAASMISISQRMLERGMRCIEAQLDEEDCQKRRQAQGQR